MEQPSGLRFCDGATAERAAAPIRVLIEKMSKPAKFAENSWTGGALPVFSRARLAFLALCLGTTVASQALCLPLLAQPTPAVHSTTTHAETFGLVHRVNVLDRDDRGPLSKKARELGLSASEEAQIRTSTGYLRCPGYHVSAATVGHPTVIITDAAAFTDASGRLKENSSQCFFENMNAQQARLDFRDEAQRVGIFGAGHSYPMKKWAIIRIRDSIPGASHFPVFPGDEPGSAISAKPALVAISAYQSGMTEDAERPLAQGCQTKSNSAPISLS